MIAICELQCRDHSHETFNCGYVYGLRLAFPHEKLHVYAHHSHIKALKSNFTLHKIKMENIEYMPINVVGSPNSIHGFLNSYWQIKKIFSEIINVQEDKLFFLSHSSLIDHILKRLKFKKKFKNIKCTFVLHGEFESLTRLDRTPTQVSSNSLNKIRNLSFKRFAYKALSRIVRTVKESPIRGFNLLYNPINRRLMARFDLEKILFYQISEDFHYIVNSPHILENAKKYINTELLCFSTVVLPTIFSSPSPPPENSHVKFGIFGYGNPGLLQKMGESLNKKKPDNNYEIRIIGMDNRGAETNPHITCPISGRPLTRNEMEHYIQDIDIQIILYEKYRYKLGCTGSILEALSHSKPIIHLDNDCINSFNTYDCPIGLLCNDIDTLTDKMKMIIENYEGYKVELKKFRKNIGVLRKKFAIENQIQQIKDSFTFVE
jgi:hypothetical protein